MYSAAAQNIQLAATAFNNQPAEFFATNDQLYNYVWNILHLKSLNSPDKSYTWQVQWSSYRNDTASCEGWCLPTSLAWTNTYTSSLAVTGWADQTRLYYVNEKNVLGELENVDWGSGWIPNKQYYGTGWGISMVDVVNNVRPPA